MKRIRAKARKGKCTNYSDKVVSCSKQGREYRFSAFLVLPYLHSRIRQIVLLKQEPYTDPCKQC